MKKAAKNKAFDRHAIALMLSAIERRDAKARAVLSKAFSKTSIQRSICFTGPAGVGKSTLISNLLKSKLDNDQNAQLAWLACDPSSAVSGGSVLGDRIRLSGADVSESVFVRSLSTRSTQAFSPAIRDMEVYLETLFDEVWVETAGSGQTQAEVADISGLTVLILQPETGDEIQWMKSGVRELADIFVVHKADLRGAELMAQSLIENGVNQDSLVSVSSKSGEGISELLKLIARIQSKLDWKKRLSKLHLAHARTLFFERRFNEAEKKFDRSKLKLIKNPYST